MLELYHSGLSTCSKQARLHLVEKGLNYVSRYIELWNHENLNPEYLKLNPDGVVPTLVHDGVAIHNSFVIMEYVEDMFPEMPLRPSNPLERAKMRLWTWTADDVHHSVITLTHSRNLAQPSKALTPTDIERIYAAMTVPARRERWHRTVTHGFDPADIDAALDQISHIMGRLDDALADGPWIVGESYSLADIAMLAIVHRLDELTPELVAPAARPRVADWYRRMRARPQVAKVYTQGEAETPARPKAMSVAGIA